MIRCLGPFFISTNFFIKNSDIFAKFQSVFCLPHAPISPPSHPETSYMTQSELCKVLKRFWTLLEPLVDLWKQSKSSKLDQVFPDLKLMLKMRKFLYVPWNEPKHQKGVWYQFLLLKKCTVLNLSKIPLKTSNLKFFGISGTPDLRSTFGKIDFTASRVPKSTCLFYNHKFLCF